MIDTDFAEELPPHWIRDSADTDLFWSWTSKPPAQPRPAMLLGDHEAHVFITESPTPGGSWLRAVPAGVMFHLSAKDAASIKARVLLFALWAAPAETPTAENLRQVLTGADAFGQIIAADWAAQPHAGRA